MNVDNWVRGQRSRTTFWATLYQNMNLDKANFFSTYHKVCWPISDLQVGCGHVPFLVPVWCTITDIEIFERGVTHSFQYCRLRNWPLEVSRRVYCC